MNRAAYFKGLGKHSSLKLPAMAGPMDESIRPASPSATDVVIDVEGRLVARLCVDITVRTVRMH